MLAYTTVTNQGLLANVTVNRGHFNSCSCYLMVISMKLLQLMLAKYNAHKNKTHVSLYHI